jgi:DnaK suppressor protein
VNSKTVKPAKAPSKVKPVVSAAAKPVTAPATKAKKPIAKPTVTSTIAAKKPASKPAPAVAKIAALTTIKPPSKLAATKAPAKSPVQTKKPVAAGAAPPKPQPPTPKVAITPKAKTPVNPSVPKSVPAAPVAVPPAPVVATASNNVVPIKSGRPSSRLAQLTVPSMAQSVASTAAKASYGPSNQSPTIALVIPAIIKKDSKLANNWKTKSAAELSDAELMAMPDSEYMNEIQLAAFRLKLSALKLGILNSAGETTEHLREDTSVVPDPADRATIEEEHALELRTRDRERKLLKKIEQSIGRIDAGDYGYCDETGEPIGVGRLLARPTATLSLEAQQRRELKQKMFGD